MSRSQTNGNGAPKNGWGGARAGAGRKPKGDVAGVSHLKREKIGARASIEVVIRVVPGVPDLRSRQTAPVIKEAIVESNERFGFRVLSHSVGKDRVVLIARAKDAAALARGMKGFNVRFARNVNRALNRTGTILADRYQAHAVEASEARRSR